MFIAGRIIIGLGTGVVAVAAPQLMTEVAYPTHRGKMVSLYMTQWVLVGYTFLAPLPKGYTRAIPLTLGFATGISHRSLDNIRNVQDGFFLELEASESLAGSSFYSPVCS